MRFRFLAACLAAAALATASCGGITDPSKNQTETFTGTLTPVSLGGSGRGEVHTFNISSNGEYTVKVTAMTPSYNGFFGTFMGTGDGCGVGVGQNNLTIVGGQALSGPVFQKGQYCVFIFDSVGNMTVSENYTLTVSHP
jgi:hypothetical protein